MKLHGVAISIVMLIYGTQVYAERSARGSETGTAGAEHTAPPVSTLEKFNEAGIQQLFGKGTIPKVQNPYTSRSSRACTASWKDIEKKRPKSVKELSQARVETIIKKVIGAGGSEKYAKRALASFMANQKSIPNQKFVSFIDFTKRSNQKRMIVMNLENMTVETFHVAAGKGSDPDGDGYATRFTNNGGSHASSLGCALVNTRFKDNKNRPAMFVHGFERTNNKSCDRDVIFHPAGYVGGIPGRSWGCPAVRPRDRKKVYERLEDGALLCSYFDGVDRERSGLKRKGKKNGRRRA